MDAPALIWQPVYEKDPSISHMVWASNGYWYVGKRDELGKQAGWMQARPAPHAPPRTPLPVSFVTACHTPCVLAHATAAAGPLLLRELTSRRFASER